MSNRQQSAATPAPARSRKLATDAKKDVAAVIKTLATEFYIENQKANAHTGKAKSARAKLLVEMQAAGIKKTDVITEIDGKPITLEAIVAAAVGNAVDVKKLSAQVTLADLLEVVSASQEAVKEKFGAHILAGVLVEVVGTTNVSVKPPKATA